jgi:predicted RNA-binding protein with PUA-like domain
MAYWLVKSEPEVHSWDQHRAAGKAGDAWTGVRNHQAKIHLNTMAAGDRAFFYHSGAAKEVVGVTEVIKTAYPDPTDPTAKFVCVNLKAVEPFRTPVTLTAIKSEPALAKMVLVVNSRLSVQPVTAAEWKHICKLGGVKG